MYNVSDTEQEYKNLYFSSNTIEYTVL